MPLPTYILLFVDDPARSEAFYRKILGADPVESSATFVLFASEAGLKLGLWSRHTAEPKPIGTAGATEVGFSVTEKAEVDGMFRTWSQEGVTIVQEPTEMDFGRTFVGVDPDGHRLRVFALDPG